MLVLLSIVGLEVQAQLVGGGWSRVVYAARRLCKGVQRDGVGSFFVENSGCDVLHVGDGDGFGDEKDDTNEVALI